MTVIGSMTVTVNAAFLREIKEVNEELWQLLRDLRGLCKSGLTSRDDRQRLVQSLDQLHDQITLHFALEEAYGYFEDPAYVAPHLSERANALRREHRSLYLEISSLAEEAETTRIDQQGWQELVGRFQKFDGRLRKHEAAEEDLILAIYQDDIGVGD